MKIVVVGGVAAGASAAARARRLSESCEIIIPEAINIPLQELRDRIDELPVEQPLYLYCRVGFRSYLAYRLLKQRGRRRVQTLAGGSKTFTTFHLTTLETGRPGAPFMAHAEEEMAILYGTLDHA